MEDKVLVTIIVPLIEKTIAPLGISNLTMRFMRYVNLHLLAHYFLSTKKLDTHVSNVVINSRMMILLILGFLKSIKMKYSARNVPMKLQR